MDTSYEYIFSEFKDKITDPDLLLFAADLQFETLLSLMNKAIARCKRAVSKAVDLEDRDNELAQYNNSLTDEVVDIITEWMTVFWLQPYVNNLENLKNHINTKDFNQYSPANLLEKIGDRYDKSRKYARGRTNEYSFLVADMKELKT